MRSFEDIIKIKSVFCFEISHSFYLHASVWLTIIDDIIKVVLRSSILEYSFSDGSKNLHLQACATSNFFHVVGFYLTLFCA